MACLLGSEPRPEAPVGMYLTPDVLYGLLDTVGRAWAYPLVRMIGSTYITTAELCASPQPIPGAFPTADFLEVLAFTGALLPDQLDRVKKWALDFGRAKQWADNCQCVAEAAPGCGVHTISNPYFQALTTAVYGPIGSGWTWTSAVEGVRMAGPGNGLYLGALIYNDPGGTSQLVWLHDGGTTADRTSPFSGSYGPNSLSAYVGKYIRGSVNNSSAEDHFNGTFTFTLGGCSGAPTYEPDPIFPPRPADLVDYPAPSVATCADLLPVVENLEGRLADVRALLGYVAAQGTPYAYSLGPASTGLSGNGFVLVVEPLGALVTLTTVPAGKGRDLGTPNRYFDVGRVHWGTEDGYHAHVPVHESPQLVFPIPAVATRIGYTFAPGVVATIQPVLRASR